MCGSTHPLIRGNAQMLFLAQNQAWLAARGQGCGMDTARLETSNAPGPFGPDTRKGNSLPPFLYLVMMLTDVNMDTDWESVGQGRKRAHRRTTRVRLFTSSSSESEEPAKKGRSRPAKDPLHEGQFTAEALARKAAEGKARQTKRDHKAILDPEIKPTSARALWLAYFLAKNGKNQSQSL